MSRAFSSPLTAAFANWTRSLKANMTEEVRFLAAPHRKGLPLRMCWEWLIAVTPPVSAGLAPPCLQGFNLKPPCKLLLTRQEGGAGRCSESGVFRTPVSAGESLVLGPFDPTSIRAGHRAGKSNTACAGNTFSSSDRWEARLTLCNRTCAYSFFLKQNKTTTCVLWKIRTVQRCSVKPRNSSLCPRTLTTVCNNNRCIFRC